MDYKGYTIAPDLTGYAPKEETYTYFEHGSGDEVLGSCETIEQCIKEIDKLIIKNIGKEFIHKGKVLSTKDVEKNRSSKYKYIDFKNNGKD